MNLRNIDGSEVQKMSGGSHKHILFDCDVCGLTVEQSYRNYLNQNSGKFCRKCRNTHTANRPDVKKKQSLFTKNRWSDEGYREKIIQKISLARKKEWEEGKRQATNKTPYIILVNLLSDENFTLITSYDDYMNNSSIINVKCSKGHIYTTNYTRWKNGHRCPVCRRADYHTILNSFSSEKYKLLTKEEDYINNNQKLKYLCPKGTHHSISWSNWQLGHRCPCCNDGMSKGEKELADFIINLGFDIELKNRNIISPLELDIVIESKKVALEYDGLYFHGTKNGNKDKKYHLDKLLKCNENGYRLITIFEDEWITKKEIVMNRLKHILTKEKGVYARNCYINEITPKTAKFFIDKYHIQGYTSCSIKLGAYYKNELVAVMTFAKGNISKGGSNQKNVWELSRFCTSCHVIGIAGKLLTFFERKYRPTEIYSYADRRWSDGNVYKQIGFTFVGFTNPNYWYFKNNTKRLHRFNFRKDKIKHLATKEDMTEWDIMQEQGYDKVYDCGNIKFIKST